MPAPKPVTMVNLTDHVVGWWSSRGAATLRGLEGSERYLPVFSSTEKLVDFAIRSGWPGPLEVQRIKDGRPFMNIVSRDLVIILGPHFTAEGRMSYGRRILD